MKYGPEITKELCAHIENGMSNVDAVALCVISEDTFYQWMKSKPEFSEAIKKAQVKNKQYHIEKIRKASEKNWVASAWWLERRYKEEFALRKEFTGKEGTPLLLPERDQNKARKGHQALKKLVEEYEW